MNKISLNGKWQLSYALENDAGAELKTVPADVPGNVEIALMEAGVLPDLFFGGNIFAARPYEFYQWTYETSFTAPEELRDKRTELVFQGVDCIATYLLNGVEIGHSENMLIEHSFDVSELLHYGQENKLTVRISSAMNQARKYHYEPGVERWNSPEAAYIRKPAHCYGWDIMARLVSAGIWRSVELIAHKATEFEELHYFTRWVGRDATLGLRYNFVTDEPIIEGFEIQVTGKCGESSFEWRGPAYFIAGDANITIPDVKPWWPLGYGDANLYEVTACLIHNGTVVDTRTTTIGIRTVELVRTDITTTEAPGEFLFKINGQPIMCKGSNWVPVDALHSRDSGRYQQALEMFRDLGCNILRSWGGSVYEDHAFFDFCDCYGIMVWQDFAMACGRYPQDPKFQAVIREEAIAVVRKLRNHPSIILWSGDNECDYNYADPADNRLTRRVLPEVVFEYDSRRPYLPSSPYYSPEVIKRNRDGNLMPEQHLWGPRDYYKGHFYTTSTAHFASEIGYHGCPNVSSIKKFIADEYLWPWQDNEQWRIHCTDPFPTPGNCAYRVPLMANQIKELFGATPDNLEEFALASQVSQAEAKKFFIEMFRLAKWRRTGIIWWNVLDGWPQFSDAIVDYYFGKKLAYQYIKRVQQPVCIMVDEPNAWNCRVVAGNDSLQDAAGPFSITDADSGETLLQGKFETRANQNSELGRIRVSHGEHRLFLIEWEVAGEKYGNHYLLGKPPISFQRYAAWLQKIAALPDSFDVETIGK